MDIEKIIKQTHPTLERNYKNYKKSEPNQMSNPMDIEKKL